MASVQILYSGQYIRNATGGTADGAKLYVYDAQTLDLASIFVDASQGTAADNPVVADSAGLMPVRWKGTGDYKVILKTSAGVTLDEVDNLPGAVEDTGSGTVEFARPYTPVITKTADYSTTSSDLGKVINCNVTGGDVEITLLSAVTAGDGNGMTLRHTGSANFVQVVTTSAQTITHTGMGATTAFAMVGYGECAEFVSDGANWHVKSYAPPLLTPSGPPIIKITDRLYTPPASPSPGARYMVILADGETTPRGDWDTYAEHDIVEANGQPSGWIKYTPPTDCGWIAYVQDEDANYQFAGSAWVTMLADSDHLSAGTATSSQAIRATDVAYLPGCLLAVIENQVTAGSDESVSGSWATRPLNTVVYDRLGIISLSANAFTIALETDANGDVIPATYEISWRSPHYGGGRTRLANTAAATTVAYATQGRWQGGTGNTMIYSDGIAVVTIDDTTGSQFLLQNQGGGGVYYANYSTPEITTRVIIRRA